ncbi:MULTISPECIES: peptidase E [unclassified Leptolyngbya]|uniref:Type 1 glutamine amidotransferase-like domain-containing protein n=1 Tax=unclassified Leptolyngbya TaxID=2650499 RepID=UPI0016875EB3|nr:MULTISPECIES: peptidase E [unclassified Leptolyngbya]MBD1909807.1 peptidase E [Leptolyngbya sp. FACHB-8]MBD2158958.1 peptidase E [Leptolyngbya sp. FACHB-16]
MSASLPDKHIVAMGGGGLSIEPDNLLLDRYVLELVSKPQPKVCFLPTASGDSDRYIVRFYSTFLKFPCQPSHLSLFHPPTLDLRGFLLEQDIIYVGGGNTKNLLALWHDWELDSVLKEAWEQGTILCGFSAGSLCWFESGVSDYPGNGVLKPLNCLGFLKGTHCPHYDGEANRRPVYHELISEGALEDGYAADDGVGLHFVNETLEKIVSSRPSAKAYRVERQDGDVRETPLEPIYLGDRYSNTQVS